MLVNLCKNWGEIMCGLWGLEGFVWDFLSFFETWVDTLIYLTTLDVCLFLRQSHLGCREFEVLHGNVRTANTG